MINTDENKINEILTRGVHEAFTPTEIKEKLLSGKQLHIKLGTDVTGANLHLGHSVIHRKIRDFQELGHKVTLIIGDFTTLVGDHSDKVDMRSETNASEIKANEKTYTDQFFKTVFENKTEIRHNSEWLKQLNFNDVINLAKQFTIAQMLDRETFLIRYKENKPIGLDEFLYPLMQGYDSVALNCDIELGGTDQTFNLLAGRKLMPVFNLIPQNAISMKLLVGSDGRPMGKSLKNYIPILDNPINMYGKLMSIVDEVIFDYLELITRIPMSDITQMKEAVEKGENPMNIKKILAKDVVCFYHGEKEALNAQKVFEETVQNKNISDDVITNVSTSGNMNIFDFLKQVLLDSVSSSEIKRTIQQGGVELNNVKITNVSKQITFKSNDIIKFGKRVFFKVK